jgi:hypothetical protein
MVRRFGISVVLAVLALALGSAAASAGPIGPIGPKQTFSGMVNGSGGSAVIRMACFGPIRPWQMGHPMAGQSVAVTRGLPVTSARAAGFTGAASSIAAYARFDSPLASPVVPRLGLFTYYDSPETISTELSLPCGGDGQVVFQPVDGGPHARPAIVRVSFQGQP